MSTKHIDTAADLVRFGASVKIDCRECGSARTLTGPDLVKRCGAGPLASARAKLRGGRCGAKKARLTILPPPNVRNGWKTDIPARGVGSITSDELIICSNGTSALCPRTSERAVPVKLTETYLRERARTERAIAEEASSPQARRAHLELALRYVKAAEAAYVSKRGSMERAGESGPQQQTDPTIRRAELGAAFRSAFPLPASGAFADLLRVVDGAQA